MKKEHSIKSGFFRKCLLILFLMINCNSVLIADVVYQDDPDIPDDWQGACVSSQFGSEQAALDYDGKIETPYTGSLYHNGSLSAEGWITADVTGSGAGQVKCKSAVYTHEHTMDSSPSLTGVSAQTLKPFSVSGTGVIETTVTIDFDGLLITKEQSSNGTDWVKSNVEYLAEIEQYNSGSGEREVVGSNTFDGVAWIQENGGGNPVINVPATYVWMEEEGVQSNSWNSNANLQIKKVVTGDAGGDEISIDDLSGETKEQAQTQMDAGRNVYYLSYSEDFNFNANAGETYYLYMDLLTNVSVSSGDWEETYGLSDFSNTVDFTLSAGGETVTTEMALNTDQTVSGNNPFGGASSDVTLSNATLNFLSDASLMESLKLVAGSQSTLNTNNNNATLSGNITGAGNLKKTGNGILTLTGNNTTTGTLTFQTGTGVLNGAWGGNIVVQSGGVLQGTGNVGGNLSAGGIVKPGNSIGTLAIVGNYTQANGSSLEIEFNNQSPPGNVDLLDITGSASIEANATIIPVAIEQITQDRTYTFMQTGGGITGDFAFIDDNYGILDFSLQKAGGNTEYQLVVDRLSYSSQAETSNQRQVASAMDKTLNSGVSGDLKTVLSAIDKLDSQQIRQAYDSLTPVIASNMGLVARNDQYTYTKYISNHLEWGRSTSYWKNTSSQELQIVPAVYNTDQEVFFTLAGNKTAISNWLWYMDSINNIGSIDNCNQVDGLDWYSSGFSVGADFLSLENLIVGASAGGLWSSVDGDKRTGSGDIGGVKTGLYSSVFNQNSYLNIMAGYGHNWNESDRPIDFLARTAHGEWDSDIVSTGLEIGRHFDINMLRITPVANLDYIMIYDEAYHETKAGFAGLRVSSEDSHSLCHQIGMRADCKICVSEKMYILPKFDVFWVHEYLDRGIDKTSKFGYDKFTITGVEPGRDSVAMGTGLNIAFNDRFTLNFDYDLSFGNHMINNYLQGGAKITF